jgi:hypothetical protein
MKLTNNDIGKPVLRGSGIPVGTGWDLTAGGEDIWDRADQFHFSHTPRTGDFDLVARLESLEEGHLYTKAGLMARASLDAGSPHVFHLVFPTNAPRNNNTGGYEAQVRDERDGPSRAFYPSEKGKGGIQFPVAFPQVWLRLTRKGSHWTCGASADGKSWTVYAEFDLGLPAELHVGLAATSHDGSRLVTARFRDVSLT